MESIMRFVGGPWDGKEQPPEPGWPAPGGVKTPDGDQYLAVRCEEEDDRVIHIYGFVQPPAEGEIDRLLRIAFVSNEESIDEE